MSPVLLLALLGLTVIGLGALVAALLRAAARERRAPSFWPAVAERLGADAAGQPDGDGTMTGRFRGSDVEFTVETRARESRHCRARIVITPSLDLGLALGSEPALREPADGASPFSTGSPVVDRRLEPRARDPRGARRLFERKPLRDRLEAALGRWTAVALSDDAVLLEADRPLVATLPLDDLLGDAVALARLIEEERPRIGN